MTTTLTESDTKMTINNAVDYRNALLAAIDARASYELSKSAENDSMQETLKDIRKSVDHIDVCAVFFLANVDSNRINRAERVNARYNVYAYEKDVNIARAAMKVASLNHYTKAILLTAKRFAEHDLMLTHNDAQSACSLSVKTSNTSREKMIVKYQKHVSAKTAATQSSSSINALQSFNVLVETRDASNVVCYRLNVENELTQKLLSVCE
jgi:hypothetical protein